jgi:hypothetical protein
MSRESAVHILAPFEAESGLGVSPAFEIHSSAEWLVSPFCQISKELLRKEALKMLNEGLATCLDSKASNALRSIVCEIGPRPDDTESKKFSRLICTYGSSRWLFPPCFGKIEAEPRL